VAKWQVPKRDDGIRLLTYLKQKLPGRFSTRMVKRAIDNKACTVNGKVEFFSTYRVKAYDRIEFRLLHVMSEDYTQSVPAMGPPIYEDDDILIINKPWGLISESPAIASNLKESYPYLELTHRLDKDTSGALVLAKNKTIKREIEELFKKREVAKRYLAIVDGVPHQAEGSLENHLGKKKSFEGQATMAPMPPPEGKFALTHWRLISDNGRIALLEVTPKTGRTHQIRVHMKLLQTPIIGDHHYGRHFKARPEIRRHMLHSYRIAFDLTDRSIDVTAPVPFDMHLVINNLFHVQDV